MLIERLIDRGTMPVLRQVMMFTEARHEVLANNVSNFDTVGFKMKDLDYQAFNEELQSAVDRRDSRGAALEMRDRRNISWDRLGRPRPRPIEIEDNNVLFHDRNNRFVEKQMSQMAQNAMRHNVAVELLRQQHDLLSMAIRERV